MMLDLTKDQRTIAAQRERIEELEETVLQLRGYIAARGLPAKENRVLAFPIEWGLTPAQTCALAALYETDREFVSNRSLAEVVCARGRGDVMTKDALLKVQLVKVRRKLAALNIEILNRHGRGYELTAASKAIIKEALERRAQG